MLRDFEYYPSEYDIREILDRFDIELPEYISLLRFEVITPDSFMWRLLIGDNVYYLYAEDYVPGLDHIKTTFDTYLEDSGREFVKPKSTIKFEDASPVTGATAYRKPSDADEMMQYTVDSGHDFVFLARSNEDTDNAQFSDSAPRGFSIAI